MCLAGCGEGVQASAQPEREIKDELRWVRASLKGTVNISAYCSEIQLSHPHHVLTNTCIHTQHTHNTCCIHTHLKHTTHTPRLGHPYTNIQWKILSTIWRKNPSPWLHGSHWEGQRRLASINELESVEVWVGSPLHPQILWTSDSPAST